LAEGDKIAVGDAFLTVMELPGHTEGSLAFVGDGFIVTGDTMFAYGDVGRVDFPTGDAVALTQSIRRLCTLDGEYAVYAGHGPTTELSKEAALHGIVRKK
jgi:glyoxylase-like metal-dependent hydrolase (beta-lactamase superfamily II)